MAQTAPTPARPRSLLVLIVVLCWQVGRGVEGLVFPARSTVYQFFSGLGLAPLHFVLDALAVAVALAALGYIWRARIGWAQSTLVALAYFALRAVVTTVFMRLSLDHAQAAFLAAASARGQSVDPDQVERLFAMGWLEVRLVISLTVLALAAWLAWRGRAYTE